MDVALVTAHALGASLALTLGGWQLLRRRRGDRAHRRIGRVWVLAMYWTVVSSFFITDLDPGHFSWIHGLSAFTFGTLSAGTWAAIRGHIGVHRQCMIGSYCGLIGAFIGAVVVPARDVPQLFVQRPLVLAVATVSVVIATVVVVALCGRPSRREELPAQPRRAAAERAARG